MLSPTTIMNWFYRHYTQPTGHTFGSEITEAKNRTNVSQSFDLTNLASKGI